MYVEYVSDARADVVWPHAVSEKSALRLVNICKFFYTDFTMLRPPQGHVQAASTSEGTPKKRVKKVRKAALKQKSAKAKKNKKKAKEDSEEDDGDSGSNSEAKEDSDEDDADSGSSSEETITGPGIIG